MASSARGRHRAATTRSGPEDIFGPGQPHRAWGPQPCPTRLIRWTQSGLSSSITPEDLDRAEAQLLQFVGAFEALYEDDLPEETCTVQEVIVHDTKETLSEVPPTQADEWLTISLTRLTMEDRQQLLGQRLSEKHICDQHLLKEEFPLVNGFRDTVIRVFSCLPVPAMAECIQMHHIGDHWAVSCTQEIKTGVTVYGSMYTTVGVSLRRQLVSLYKHHVSVDEGILPVTAIRAQRQRLPHHELFPDLKAESDPNEKDCPHQ
ncbi:hypothetical protein Bbelb_292130 [Branchiostoma belcheri]|nr:hypothetical protein Bbelb_292130 [Branchiostoma belcheri]